MAIKLRELADEEKAAITKLARSRTAAAREVGGDLPGRNGSGRG
jgi:hypothetical protein